MRCDEIKSNLGRFVDDELDGPACEELRGHLDQCAACRAEFQSLRALGEALAGSDEVSVPDGLWDAIERRLDAEPIHENEPRTRRLRPGPRIFTWRPLATAAVLLLAIGISWLSWNAPWEATTTAAEIDFRPILERTDGDIEAGIHELVRVYGGREVTLDDVKKRMSVRVHLPAKLPRDMTLESAHLLNLGSDHNALSFHLTGPRGQVLLVQCSASVEKNYGTEECLPCTIGSKKGQIVRKGPLRLMHFESDNVCVCVISTLDEHGDLPAVMDSIKIDY